MRQSSFAIGTVIRNNLHLADFPAGHVLTQAMGAISGDKTSIGKAFDYSFKKYVDAEEMGNFAQMRRRKLSDGVFGLQIEN